MSELNLHKNITIVIVLYQEPFELLSKTLNTINSFKKIIIDNNGNIELKKKIKSQFSVDQYILNKKNNGFSAGYNQGISLSNTEFTLVLGPDCIIKEQDIGILIRKIKENIDRFQYHDPKRINEIELLLQNILWQLRKLDIKSDFLDRRFRSVMFIRQMFSSIVFVIIGMPLFLYGLWHNMIQYKLTDFIVPKITKDIEYYAPLAVLLSMVLYPCFYTFFFYLVSHIFEMSSIVEIIYIISMPLSGFYAYWFNRYLKHISYKWRYILLMVSDSKAMEELKAKRKQLRSLIFED